MNRIEAMQTFVRIAELSSFTRAADTLQIPKASASSAVQQLEGALGTRLLHRTTRKVQLTQDGGAFYERCKEVLAELDELESMFQRGPLALRGRLRVDMPSSIACELVLPQLPDFLAQHPQVEIELGSADRRVDLVREGFDCVLRIGTLADSTLVARPLGQVGQINCASPAYLARRGTPKRLDDLQHHSLIHYVPAFGARPTGWEYAGPSGSATMPMAGSLSVNGIEAYQAGCLAGLGLIQAPAAWLRPLLDDGRLVEVLPDFRPPPMPVSLLYAHRRLPKRVHVFMTWLTERLQPYLDAPADGHRAV